MTPKVLLTLVAVVVGADGGAIQIDKGLTDGLRPGDRGDVFYELSVAGESRRVGLGSVDVLSVEASRASAGLLAGKSVRPGFKVEFEFGKERLSPGSLVRAAREHLGEEAAARLAEGYREELRPAAATPDAGLQEPPAEPPADAPAEPPAAAAPNAPLTDRSTKPSPATMLGMLRMAAGAYRIGLDTGSAKFYNESPQFERTLAGFWIDATPAEPTGFDFAQAQAFCEGRGQRLPSEFEWEVAAPHPSFQVLERFEWTSSWYTAYPGNRRPEEAYGKRYRVLRGSTDAGSFRAQERRYFVPGQSSPNVGFRCASSGATLSPSGPE